MADLSKVQQTIQTSNVPGVQKLNARLSGDTIEITGQADSIAAKQAAMKAITSKHGDMGLINKIEVVAKQNVPQPPAAGAAPGAAASAPAASAPASAQTASQARTHVVAKNETLSHIAQKYYGKASEYKKIFEANRDQLKDPDKIREGMKLQIP